MGARHSPLWALRIRTSPEAEEALAEWLTTLTDSPAVSYFDVHSRQVTLTVHLARLPQPLRQLRPALKAGLTQVASFGLDPAPGRIQIERLRRREWAEAWKRHFPAFVVADRLLVRPSWSRRRPAKRHVEIVLDPGLSFGTGHHPTTRFCLDQLVACRDPGQRQSFLDIGTGSGLLALAAARLDYQPVLAFDHDPQAVAVARRNARRNRLTRRLQISRHDLRKFQRRRPAQFDFVCANLTADLLVSERERIGNCVSPGGKLALAGILRTELDAVVEAYAGNGFTLQRAGEGGFRTKGESAPARLAADLGLLRGLATELLVWDESDPRRALAEPRTR
jgi:ribosomal protein L11 methyltransferase